MERGLATHLDQHDGADHPHRAHDNRIVALYLHQGFPEMQLAEETIRRGVARFGESAVWVVPETDKTACDLLARLEVEAVRLPLNPHWKYPLSDGAKIGWFKHKRRWVWGLQWRERDDRKMMRDGEVLTGADDILVFIPEGSGSWWDKHADDERVHLIRRGKLKKRR